MANWFVAFPIELPPRFTLEEVPDGLEPLHLNDLHCTLAFLGQVSPTRIPRIVELLDAVNSPTLSISLCHPIMLPSKKNFSALALSVDGGGEALCSLIAAHRDTFYEAAGCAIEQRPVLAHVTIARPRRRITSEQKNVTAEWCRTNTARYENVVVDRVALYTWATDRSRQKFEIVAEHRLMTTS